MNNENTPKNTLNNLPIPAAVHLFTGRTRNNCGMQSMLFGNQTW